MAVSKMHETRREQIEEDFVPVVMAATGPRRKRIVRKELRGAAMVGACEERSRTLALLRGLLSAADYRACVGAITQQPVLQVLGYEEPGKKLG